jgi:alpha-tubulin suppressor-like RCC1 family protein
MSGVENRFPATPARIGATKVPIVSAHRPLVVLLLLPALCLGGSACRQDPVSADLTEAGAPSTVVTTAAALVFRGVSPGMGFHTCGVTTGDLAYCWGGNGDYGALGDGTYATRLRPVAVVGGIKFRQVSAGWGHTCALTTDNRAYCWGLNTDGGLGNGTNASSNRPVAVVGGLRFLVVETGAWHTCGLTTVGRAYCWGNNEFGHLGDGTKQRRNDPVAVRGGHTFTQIGASWEHTCAIDTSGVAWCWGSNKFGQLGAGDKLTRWTPTKVVGGHLFAQISAGGEQQRGTTCAVTSAHKAYCWGSGFLGRRGDGDGSITSAVVSPRAVAGSQLFDQIVVGYYHTCAVNTNDRAWCWGYNFSGELGDGTTTMRLTPTKVMGTLSFAQLSTGQGWTCGTTTTGVGYCWGSNSAATLGDGTQVDRHVPTRIVGPM